MAASFLCLLGLSVVALVLATEPCTQKPEKFDISKMDNTSWFLRKYGPKVPGDDMKCIKYSFAVNETDKSGYMTFTSFNTTTNTTDDYVATITQTDDGKLKINFPGFGDDTMVLIYSNKAGAVTKQTGTSNGSPYESYAVVTNAREVPEGTADDLLKKACVTLKDPKTVDQTGCDKP